jgi:hypothetical protein
MVVNARQVEAVASVRREAAANAKRVPAANAKRVPAASVRRENVEPSRARAVVEVAEK